MSVGAGATSALDDRRRHDAPSRSRSRSSTSRPIIPMSPAPSVMMMSPGRGPVDQVAGDGRPRRLEDDLRRRQRDVGRHRLAARPGDRRLAGREHLEHDHLVGQPEGGAELLDEHGRPVVVVRLEGDDQPAVPDDVAGRAQRRLDLGRVVGIVVEDADLAHLALEVESAPRAAERLQARAQVRGRVVQPEAGHEGGQRVERVVLARAPSARSPRGGRRCGRCRRPSPSSVSRASLSR